MLRKTDPFTEAACDSKSDIHRDWPWYGHREGLETRKGRACAGGNCRTRCCRLPDHAAMVRACATATWRKLAFVALVCQQRTDKREEQDEENE